MAYTNFIDLEIGGIGAAMDAVATARGRLRATENDFTRAFEAMEASRDQKLVDKANSLDGDKAALDKANASADPKLVKALAERERSEEHTSELQSLMRISYAVFCLQK